MNLEAVARLAGVSRSTVSRVLNGSPGVSPRTRAAVLAAVSALRYRRNQAARSLASTTTDTVAVVISEDPDRTFDDAFLAGVLRGITAGLAGRRVVVAMNPFEVSDVDGAIVLSLSGHDPLPGRLPIPVVLVGRPLGPGVSYVDSDNLGGGALAGAHLVARGRSRVGVLAGPPDVAACVDRVAGLRRALGSAVPAGVVPCALTTEAGAAAMAGLLATTPDLDGVFCASDTIAIGALRYLRSVGTAVPESLSVVSFDDTALAQVCTPTLTTVRHSPENLGSTAAWRLAAQLAGEQDLPQSIVLPTELVVRESS
ncbi:DNA-binding LacI/PurR family transcriptional regulator [Actinokineospora baliensis]|uniref:LacI family DNA-binding transcriptional regulator n=1 Tax=Actinokineospora baliensis TaxID=547056 RepID=UPI001957786F|nr:LacI family DNA-binding transcriptional regulator [Actinokineospora baliensis]MBM7776160.1 DNA-binding LacI/PurR family transcriptional regulator [Actinokineospora baliensis]